MAINKEGILGPFSGKVGPVVGASWRGKPILRSAPTKSDKPRSPKQLRNSENFLVVEAFLNPMSDLFDSSFSIPQPGKTERNLASSFNNPDALDKTAETVTLIYSKVLISQGILRGLEEPQVQWDAPGVLAVNWQDNSHEAMAWRDDVLFAVIYVPVLKEYLYFEEAALRSDGTALLDVPVSFTGYEMHGWAGFRSTSEPYFSNSRYLGVF